MKHSLSLCACVVGLVMAGPGPSYAEGPLQWTQLPALPDDQGFAGPFVGVHGDALIVAGGANFPTPPGEDRWKLPKVWHDRAFVLTREGDGIKWHDGFKLHRPLAYGGSATTRFGLVCVGGDDGKQAYRDVFLLTWNATHGQLKQTPLPALPEPVAYGGAAVIGDTVYLAGGQSTPALASATATTYRIDLSKWGQPGHEPVWEKLPDIPGGPRAFPVVAAQHNGFETCLYVMSGRRANPDLQAAMNIVPLTDVWEFSPSRGEWRPRRELPHPMMAGTAAAVGQSHLFLLTGDTGELWTRIDELQDNHPGFVRNTLIYHTITDTWTAGPETPAPFVTTPVVRWGDAFVLATGEVKPRHRTRQMWRITLQPTPAAFGMVNSAVLGVYLAAMLGIGIWFTRGNRSTDDFFRGGQRIPWWVAGMSIYATMLSSITYMAVPAKAFAQDWAYLLGNFMILAVAPLAVYVALPFFRRIDATSAYEYLERRFNLTARLFGSASFTLFHIFRMAIVMSLAGLALAVVTPLTPSQCVLLIGVLSVVYTSLGGVTAVVWTDTVQAIVLLAGAVLCVALLFVGAGSGLSEGLSAAWEDRKLRMVNWHWDATASQLALWVVILGAIGQNVASYTSDQAVVQRYLTTSTQGRAARAIWTNAVVSVPGSILFFAMGIGLYLFYRANPHKLDPTYSTDQILPLFISHELPVGLAGLVVAGIFAAAQSTVSTSMNSTATTILTDFVRPLQLTLSERSCLHMARGLTVLLGMAGTALGLLFVNPAIRSLWDQFIAVIGLFMGVLGGMFLLGMLTTRANGPGAIVGALGGAAAMFVVWRYTAVQGYLYAFIGIGVSFIVGYATSLLLPPPSREAIQGLTVFSLRQQIHKPKARAVAAWIPA